MTNGTTMTPKEEYEYTFKLENELNRTRWPLFTALLSISLVMTGLLLKELESLDTCLGKYGMVFSWLIFMAAYVHYLWFHHRAHLLRERLYELEQKLDIKVFTISKQPVIFLGIRVRYHWMIHLLAVAYLVLLMLILFHC